MHTAGLPVTESTSVTIADLRASRKAIEDQIKALKAATPAMPERDSLAAEIAKQCEHPTLALVHSLGNYARQRVKLGQAPDAAKADLLALCTLLIDAALATPRQAKASEPAE